MNEFVQAGLEVGKLVGTGVIAAGPLTKLIEVVSSGIGTLYKPHALRQEADAKAYEKVRMAEADTAIALLKYEPNNDLLARTNQRILIQEVKRQQNIEDVVEFAVSNLPAVVSEASVDENWRTRFFSRVQDITSIELQSVWGRILAEEVTEPGKTSLRTLDVLSNLTQYEALIFNSFAGFYFQDGSILLRISPSPYDFSKWGVTMEDLYKLVSAGLILPLTSSGLNFESDSWVDNGIKKFPMHYGKLKYIVSFTAGTIINCNFSAISLTSAGAEILAIIKKEPNIDYLLEFIESQKNLGYSFERFE